MEEEEQRVRSFETFWKNGKVSAARTGPAAAKKQTGSVEIRMPKASRGVSFWFVHGSVVLGNLRRAVPGSINIVPQLVCKQSQNRHICDFSRDLHWCHCCPLFYPQLIGADRIKRPLNPTVSLSRALSLSSLIM